jgi:hypothetical protein
MNEGLTFGSALYAKLLRAGSRKWEDLGFLSDRCVTTVGVNWLSAGGAFTELTTHATGQDDTAESVSDTAMKSLAGSTSAGIVSVGSSPNIVRCVGIITYSQTYNIVEYGVFAGGILWDRSVVGKVEVHCGDKVQWVYELTINAGG